PRPRSRLPGRERWTHCCASLRSVAAFVLWIVGIPTTPQPGPGKLGKISHGRRMPRWPEDGSSQLRRERARCHPFRGRAGTPLAHRTGTVPPAEPVPFTNRRTSVSRLPFPLRRGLAVLVLAGGPVATLPAQDPPKRREQQIADIEKQLADLQKRLDELKGKSGTPAGTKKPLTFAEVDTWRSIRGAMLSPDGKWFAHRVGPNEGEAEVILRNNADG